MKHTQISICFFRFMLEKRRLTTPKRVMERERWHRGWSLFLSQKAENRLSSRLWLTWLHDEVYEAFLYNLNSAALFLVRYFYILKWHFWDLSIDMGIFRGSWFLHNHEIPHPNQWGSMKSHKEMMFIQWRPQRSRFYLYIGSERSAFQCAPILLARWQNVG